MTREPSKELEEEKNIPIRGINISRGPMVVKSLVYSKI